MARTYEIVRFHFNGEGIVLQRGVTLEEAQEHCEDPETSYKTCTRQQNIRYTEIYGAWFDGYRPE